MFGRVVARKHIFLKSCLFSGELSELFMSGSQRTSHSYPCRGGNAHCSSGPSTAPACASGNNRRYCSNQRYSRYIYIYIYRFCYRNGKLCQAISRALQRANSAIQQKQQKQQQQQFVRLFYARKNDESKGAKNSTQPPTYNIAASQRLGCTAYLTSKWQVMVYQVQTFRNFMRLELPPETP